MSGTIIGSLPYIQMSQTKDQPTGGLLKPCDAVVRRAETISHIGYESIRPQPTRNRALSTPGHPNGYQKLGDEYLAKKEYELATKAYVKTNDTLNTEKAIKEWYSGLLEFINIADKDLQKGSLPAVRSALAQYEGIYDKLIEMERILTGKYDCKGIQAQICHIFQKISESKRKIEEINAPITIHEAKTCLINSSLKREEDLPVIMVHCKSYLEEARKLNSHSRNNEECRKIKLIFNQAVALNNRLNHLRSHLYYYGLDQSWDETLIKAIQNLDPKPSALYGDHSYLTNEYVELFNNNQDLREGVISLSESGFLQVMKKIQGYLTQYMTRKFSFLDCICMHPYKFELRPHDRLKVEDIRAWIAEARKTYEIQDIQNVLDIRPLLRDPAEEKEP